MTSPFFRSLAAIVSIFVLISWVAAQKTTKEMKTAEERVDKASTVITEIMGAGDKSIPRDLLEKANAIVVFPGSLKVGLIVGGQGGHGIAVRRLANGWSAPGISKYGRWKYRSPNRR